MTSSLPAKNTTRSFSLLFFSVYSSWTVQTHLLRGRRSFFRTISLFFHQDFIKFFALDHFQSNGSQIKRQSSFMLETTAHNSSFERESNKKTDKFVNILKFSKIKMFGSAPSIWLVFLFRFNIRPIVADVRWVWRKSTNISLCFNVKLLCF